MFLGDGSIDFDEFLRFMAGLQLSNDEAEMELQCVFKSK